MVQAGKISIMDLFKVAGDGGAAAPKKADGLFQSALNSATARADAPSGARKTGPFGIQIDSDRSVVPQENIRALNALAARNAGSNKPTDADIVKAAKLLDAPDTVRAIENFVETLAKKFGLDTTETETLKQEFTDFIRDLAPEKQIRFVEALRILDETVGPDLFADACGEYVDAVSPEGIGGLLSSPEEEKKLFAGLVQVAEKIEELAGENGLSLDLLKEVFKSAETANEITKMLERIVPEAVTQVLSSPLAGTDAPPDTEIPVSDTPGGVTVLSTLVATDETLAERQHIETKPVAARPVTAESASDGKQPEVKPVSSEGFRPAAPVAANEPRPTEQLQPFFSRTLQPGPAMQPALRAEGPAFVNLTNAGNLEAAISADLAQTPPPQPQAIAAIAPQISVIGENPQGFVGVSMQAAPNVGAAPVAHVFTNPIAQFSQPSAAAPDAFQGGLVSAGRQEAMIHRISQAVDLSMKTNQGQMTVRLDPPHLGEVKLDIRIRGGKVNLEIFTQNSDAREIVSKQMGNLVEKLNSQGVRFDRVNVASEDHGDRERGGNGGFAGDGRQHGRDERQDDTERRQFAFEEEIERSGGQGIFNRFMSLAG